MDEIVKGTLDWCNEIRAQKDLEPLDDLPKGLRSDPKSCPCGDATGAKVFSDRFDITGQGPSWTPGLPVLPQVVKDFVRKFDDGEYPQYERKIV